jgi:excisionase family DNA binding protein
MVARGADSFTTIHGRFVVKDRRELQKLNAGYRINEASIAAGISRSTIYKLMTAGKLRTTKVGGRRLILREDLQALLHAGAE